MLQSMMQSVGALGVATAAATSPSTDSTSGTDSTSIANGRKSADGSYVNDAMKHEKDV